MRAMLGDRMHDFVPSVVMRARSAEGRAGALVVMRRAAGEFSEDDHPRGEGGKTAKLPSKPRARNAKWRDASAATSRALLSAAVRIRAPRTAAGNYDALLAYWGGEGAIGEPGGFARCVDTLTDKVDDPEAVCATIHHDVTGEWPGRGQASAAPVEACSCKGHGTELASVAPRRAAPVVPFSEPFPVPDYPPLDWFTVDGAKAAGLATGDKITVTDEGQVFGYFYETGVCIIDGTDECWMPDPSPSGYQLFHQGSFVSDDGKLHDMYVGVIGNVGGHASPNATANAAVRHYADPNCQVILCRAYDTPEGGVVCGSLVPGATYGDVALIRRSALSGDWRWFQGGDLVARAAAVADGYDCLGPTIVNRPGLPLVKRFAGTRAAAANGAHPVYLGGMGGVHIAPDDDDPLPALLAVADALEAEVHQAAELPAAKINDLPDLLRGLVAQAALTGCEYLIDGYLAPVEQPMVVRAEHQDVLDAVVPAVFPGHDVTDVARSFFPTAQRATVNELLSRHPAERGGARVDASARTTARQRAAVADALASPGAVTGIAPLRRQVVKLVTADLAGGRLTRDAAAGRVRLLVSELARVATEHGAAKLASLASDDVTAALHALLGLDVRHASSSSTINNLEDRDFAYIEPGGKKDADGKTTPRSLRHFPIHDAAHVRNALSRAPQSPFGDKAMSKINQAAKKFGIGDAKQGAYRIALAAAGPVVVRTSDGTEFELDPREANLTIDADGIKVTPLVAAAGDEMAKCATCDGTGMIREGSVECPDCKGSGEVPADSPKAAGLEVGSTGYTEGEGGVQTADIGMYADDIAEPTESDRLCAVECAVADIQSALSGLSGMVAQLLGAQQAAADEKRDAELASLDNAFESAVANALDALDQAPQLTKV